MGGFGRLKQFTIAEDEEDEENVEAIAEAEGTINWCTSLYFCCLCHSH